MKKGNIILGPKGLISECVLRILRTHAPVVHAACKYSSSNKIFTYLDVGMEKEQKTSHCKGLPSLSIRFCYTSNKYFDQNIHYKFFTDSNAYIQ